MTTRLDLLSCNFKDFKLVNALEQTTGHNVCATADLLGQRARVGSWDLDSGGKDVIEYFVNARLRQWHIYVRMHHWTNKMLLYFVDFVASVLACSIYVA